MECDIRSFAGSKVVEHIVMENQDTKATNTEQNPFNVVPHNKGNAEIKDGYVLCSLPKFSWNVIRIRIES